MKLFLYSSYLLSPEHRDALHRLVGKPPEDIRFAAIENAVDAQDGATEWVQDSRNALAGNPAQIEVIDLRQWRGDRPGLRAKLAGKDVIWLCGGNTFYLRWILKETGADEIIRELVGSGVVYAGWSAGAVVAGPTLRCFEAVEDLAVVPEAVFDGLDLTDIVVVPHMDLEEFAAGMQRIEQQLRQEGFRTAPLVEAQALVVQPGEHQII
jgi:dipeptidase E